MSQRDMWKMLHLLNNTGGDHLTTQQLKRAGIDCYNDTLVPLMQSGAVINTGDRWELSSAAIGVLNHCTVANRMPGAAEVQVDRKNVFVIMPFRDTEDIWLEYVRPAIERAELQPIRGDITLRTGNLAANVWRGILECGCAVAELSRENPNVYYEVGLAHALGRDTFVLGQQGADLPADLKGVHYVLYDQNDLVAAREDLAAKLIAWRDHEDIQVAGTEALFS